MSTILDFRIAAKAQHKKTKYPLDIPRVHTSDLNADRRCRRKAYLGSYMWQNLARESERQNDKLWFGSGMHFVMEYYHGYDMDPQYVYDSYQKAWPEPKRPDNWEDLAELAAGMIHYYTTIWLPGREFFPIARKSDGTPMVEIKFEVPIKHPITGEILAIYEGQFDGIVTDTHSRLWVLEYKTAKQFIKGHLDMDFQMTAYTWAAKHMYEKDFEGCLYVQMHKSFPKDPLVLKTGGLSLNKNQRTSYRRYSAALKTYYEERLGTKIPMERYHEYLEYLKEEETPDADKFVRRDFVYRNETELASWEEQAGYQVLEMLSRTTSGYFFPNPTRDCSWDCDFQTACLAMNDGSDYEQMLGEFKQRKDRYDWQANLPEKFRELAA